MRAQDREALFRYVWGLMENRNCRLYRINAVEDHVHILSGLHPSIALADFVKDIKVSTSMWIKENGLFPGFAHWQDGYGAFTHSEAEKAVLVGYIRSQEEHHKTVSFIDEFKRILNEAGVKFEERFLG